MDITGLGSLFELGGKLIDRFWPDATEAEKAKVTAFLAELDAESKARLAQITANTAEATNPSVFVSGARPFIVWMCGFAMGYAAILEPLARFVAQVIFSYHGMFPIIDTTLTTQILMGILGLGGLRTYEKVKGVIK